MPLIELIIEVPYYFVLNESFLNSDTVGITGSYQVILSSNLHTLICTHRHLLFDLSFHDPAAWAHK